MIGTPDPSGSAHILTFAEIKALADAPKTDAQVRTFREAMELISKVEAEEAHTAMPRAAQVILHASDRIAGMHEKEQKVAEKMYEKKKESEK